MKTKEETVGLVAGRATSATKDICRLLAKEGISAIVVQKDDKVGEIEEPDTLEDQHQWSGQPGKDLFFNGWKLLF
ncbi:hypothetical protein [Spirosoma daeguense]